jgi:group I intron endonuclease
MKNKSKSWEEIKNTLPTKKNEQLNKNGIKNIIKKIKKKLTDILKNNIEIERKNHNEKSGIYLIYCLESEKFYIGSATDLIKRRDSHLSYLRNNKHSNLKLQRAWNKYLESNFKFYIVEIVENPTDLIEREQYYLDTLLSARTNYRIFDSIGYNIAENALRPLLNKTLSLEAKKNISIKNSGKNNGMYGRKMSEEAKEHLRQNGSKFWLNKKLPAELIEKRQKTRINNDNILKGSRNPWAKLTEQQVLEIRKQYKDGLRICNLAKQFNQSTSNICDVVHRKSWKHI